MWLLSVWTEWRPALVIVKPETVSRGTAVTFGSSGDGISRRRTGRPPALADVRALIRAMSRTNPRWGTPRIHGELLKLGIEISQSTVANTWSPSMSAVADVTHVLGKSLTFEDLRQRYDAAVVVSQNSAEVPPSV
jgi:hypothetical protein